MHATQVRDSDAFLSSLSEMAVIKPGMPSYLHIRALMRRNADLLRRTQARGPDRTPFRPGDLPTLFLSALVDPHIARGLKTCSVDYEVTLADSWDELLDLHPLWCPAYVRFVACLKGADALLSACGADTLDHFIRLNRDPMRAVLLLLLKRGDALTRIRDYADRIRGLDVGAIVAQHIETSEEQPQVDLGRGLAARSLLYALLGDSDARDMARDTVERIMVTVEDYNGSTGVKRMCRLESFLFSARTFQTWGLVHSLVGLDEQWDDLFARRAQRATLSACPTLPSDLCIPEVGGESFGRLCNTIRTDVMNWLDGLPRVSQWPPIETPLWSACSSRCLGAW